MRKLFLQFSLKSSFSSAKVSKISKKKATHKILFQKNLDIFNPIIEKPLLSKALDNEIAPELIKTPQPNLLLTILTDMQAEKTPIFTMKNLSFTNMAECLQFLITNKENLAENAFKYLERLYLTIISSKSIEIKALLKNEENTAILSELYQEIENKASITAFFPGIRDINKFDLREIVEIPEIARFFIYILHDYMKKNSFEMELRRNIELLKSWDNLMQFYLSDKRFSAKLTFILQISFEKINMNIDKLMFKEKISLCIFMKYVRFFDSGFLDYMTTYCDLNFEKLDLTDILLVIFLTTKLQKATPFELLYRMRKTLMINLKKINSKNLLRILEIYSKKKLFFFEKFIETVFLEISSEKSWGSYTNIEYVLLLYHYSNSKFRDEGFFEKIMVEIERVLEHLKTTIYFNLVMLSLAHLNYTKPEFFIKMHRKFNLFEVLEKVKKEENLYEDEKEYFKILLTKLGENENRGVGVGEEKKVIEGEEKVKEILKENNGVSVLEF